jgi:hypothetical protein
MPIASYPLTGDTMKMHSGFDRVAIMQHALAASVRWGDDLSAAIHHRCPARAIFNLVGEIDKICNGASVAQVRGIANKQTAC